MKSLRSIPRILAIQSVNGYKLSCLFNNGESRVIDFQVFLKEYLSIDRNHLAYPLLQDQQMFSRVKILGNSIGWEEIGLNSTDENGNPVFYPYDLDPLVLYQQSKPDPEEGVQIGLMIRQERKEKGLTQAELAKLSGTSKHYISRLENSRSDIELLTLKKIVEAGLGKKLSIEII